jgi:hypothetical protein
MSESVRSSSRRKRRILLFVFIPPTGIVAFYLMGWGSLRFWNANLPSGAPMIAMTPDDGWMARLGFTTLTYDRIFSRAGGRLVKLQVPDTPAAFKPAEVHKMLKGMDALLLTGGGDVGPELYGGNPSCHRVDLGSALRAERHVIPHVSATTWQVSRESRRSCRLVTIDWMWLSGTLRGVAAAS